MKHILQSDTTRQQQSVPSATNCTTTTPWLKGAVAEKINMPDVWEWFDGGGAGSSPVEPPNYSCSSSRFVKHHPIAVKTRTEIWQITVGFAGSSNEDLKVMEWTTQANNTRAVKRTCCDSRWSFLVPGLLFSTNSEIEGTGIHFISLITHVEQEFYQKLKYYSSIK